MKIAGKKVPNDALPLFYRQLALLSAAGLSISEAFRRLAQFAENKAVRDVCRQVSEKMQGDAPLSDCLSLRPDLINGVLAGLLEKRWDADKLPDALHRMADTAETTGEYASGVKEVLFYPTKVLIIALFVFLVLMIYVIPVFEDMFASFGGFLPEPTRAVLAASLWCRANIVILICVFAAVFLVMRFNSQAQHALAMAMPGLGRLVKNSSLIHYGRSLSMLLKFDFPFSEALVRSAHAVPNAQHARILTQLSPRVSEPARMKEEMARTGIFPASVIDMMELGDSVQTLARSFDVISDYFEKGFRRSLKRVVSGMEILAFILIAVIVGGLVISMYLPIFSMAGVVS